MYVLNDKHFPPCPVVSQTLDTEELFKSATKTLENSKSVVDSVYHKPPRFY